MLCFSYCSTLRINLYFAIFNPLFIYVYQFQSWISRILLSIDSEILSDLNFSLLLNPSIFPSGNWVQIYCLAGVRGVTGVLNSRSGCECVYQTVKDETVDPSKWFTLPESRGLDTQLSG